MRVHNNQDFILKPFQKLVEAERASAAENPSFEGISYIVERFILAQ